MKQLIQISIIKGLPNTQLLPIREIDNSYYVVLDSTETYPPQKLEFQDVDIPHYQVGSYGSAMIIDISENDNLSVLSLRKMKVLIENAITNIKEIEPDDEVSRQIILTYNTTLNRLNNML